MLVTDEIPVCALLCCTYINCIYPWGSGRIFRDVQRRIEDVWTHKQACQHLKTYGRWNWINHRSARISSVRRKVKSRCLHEVLHCRENIVFSALLLQCSRTILTAFCFLQGTACMLHLDERRSAQNCLHDYCIWLDRIFNFWRLVWEDLSSWIEEAPSNRANNPVIYGHGSHMTFKTASFEIQNYVTILCFPPHTSHALQPLDGVFKPLKTKWREILKVCARESRMSGVDKATFPHLLSKLWSEFNFGTATAGFWGAELVPLDRSKVPPRMVGGTRKGNKMDSLARRSKKRSWMSLFQLRQQQSKEH